MCHLIQLIHFVIDHKDDKRLGFKWSLFAIRLVKLCTVLGMRYQVQELELQDKVNASAAFLIKAYLYCTKQRKLIQRLLKYAKNKGFDLTEFYEIYDPKEFRQRTSHNVDVLVQGSFKCQKYARPGEIISYNHFLCFADLSDKGEVIHFMFLDGV